MKQVVAKAVEQRLRSGCRAVSRKCVASAVMVCVVCFPAACTGGEAEPEKPEETEASSSVQPLEGERADEMVADISSGDRKQIQRSLVLPDDVVLTRKTVQALKAQPDWEIDPETFTPLGSTSATVLATVDGADEPWTVYLEQIDGEWMAVMTNEPTQ